MQLVSFCVDYHIDKMSFTFETDESERAISNGADFVTEFDGTEFSLAIKSRRQVVVDRCVVTFRHEFTPEERFVANGYQSWTATRVLDADSRVRGLDHVPKMIVDRWQLDSSGDYRFTPYADKPGAFHAYTYLDIQNGDEHTLLASLDESMGFTLIRMDVDSDLVTFDAELPACVLAPGVTRTLVHGALCTGTGDAAYDQMFSLMDVDASQTLPLVGYTSWYRHGKDVTEAKLMADLAGTRDVLEKSLPKDNGALPAFQLDDGWCMIGDWDRPDTVDFPSGMAAIAKRIADAGFVPGIWCAPFVCELSSHLFSLHPNWILRDENGAMVRSGTHWSGHYALDTLNPEVRQYVRQTIGTLTREWGYKLLKLDFLYAACMICHDGKNRGELMTDALDLIREAAGPDVLLLGCGVPLGPAFGRVDYCRIGPDVGKDWDDALYMRPLHRERISTKNSIGCTIARAPLNGRAFGCDPDVISLRSSVRLTKSQRGLLLDAARRHASVLFTSDDMAAWDEKQLAAYKDVLNGFLEQNAKRRHAQ